MADTDDVDELARRRRKRAADDTASQDETNESKKQEQPEKGAAGGRSRKPKAAAGESSSEASEQEENTRADNVLDFRPNPNTAEPMHAEVISINQEKKQRETAEEREAQEHFEPPVQKKEFRLRRATDLLVAPMQKDVRTFKMDEQNIESLVSELEDEAMTGVVKTSSESRLSRSGMLLYRGRVVGCIYGCKSMPDTQPTEQSLKLMLKDMMRPDTAVKMYKLPESVILAMAALFLGYPVHREDNFNARNYVDHICAWFESKRSTACLTVTSQVTDSTAIVFLFEGTYLGSFFVDEQKFLTEKDSLYGLLQKDPKANVEASILPDRSRKDKNFGFSLSLIR